MRRLLLEADRTRPSSHQAKKLYEQNHRNQNLCIQAVSGVVFTISKTAEIHTATLPENSYSSLVSRRSL